MAHYLIGATSIKIEMINNAQIEQITANKKPDQGRVL